MDVRIAREPIATVIGEIWPLLQAHWREIAQYPDIPLCPDWDQYYLAESCQQLRIYTARIDAKLVGYAVYLVGHAMHYAKSLQAKQDVLFLLPEYRLGRIGYRLITFADEELRKDRIQVVYQHVKPVYDFGPLLKRIGYVKADDLYSRRLD